MITLSTVIYDGIELVPHFIKHYAALGVEAILLAVHERIYDDVLHFTSGYPAFVFPFWRGHFDCTEKHAMEKTLVNFFDAGPMTTSSIATLMSSRNTRAAKRDRPHHG